MASPLASILAYFTGFTPGKQLIDGSDLQTLVKLLFTATTGITALAGGGQAGATQLSQGINRVDTVASSSDSVMLPFAIPGNLCVVKNKSATTLAIFGQVANPQNPTAGSPQGIGDTIATSQSNTQQATATGITLATTLTAIFYCFKLGEWQEFLTA